MDSIHTETYKDHQIDIHIDEDCQSPLEDQECNIITNWYRGGLDNPDKIDLLPDLNAEQIKTNLDDIKSLLNQPTLLRATSEAPYTRQAYGSAVEAINACLYEQFRDSTRSTQIDMIQAVHAMIDIPTASGQLRDSYFIIIPKPELVDECGVDAQRFVNSVADEYKQWADGACYGYVISKPCPCCNKPKEIEACWGFIGDYDDVVDEAKAFIDHEITEAA